MLSYFVETNLFPGFPAAEALTVLPFLLLDEYSELLAYSPDLAVAGVVGCVCAHTSKILRLMLKFIS